MVIFPVISYYVFDNGRKAGRWWWNKMKQVTSQGFKSLNHLQTERGCNWPTALKGLHMSRSWNHRLIPHLLKWWLVAGSPFKSGLVLWCWPLWPIANIGNWHGVSAGFFSWEDIFLTLSSLSLQFSRVAWAKIFGHIWAVTWLFAVYRGLYWYYPIILGL